MKHYLLLCFKSLPNDENLITNENQHEKVQNKFLSMHNIQMYNS